MQRRLAGVLGDLSSAPPSAGGFQAADETLHIVDQAMAAAGDELHRIGGLHADALARNADANLEELREFREQVAERTGGTALQRAVRATERELAMHEAASARDARNAENRTAALGREAANA